MSVRWGMVVDVNRCVGCQTCTVACKHTNDTVPGVQWRRVLDVETGSFPDVERLFLVVGCQHCAEPPCVPVCPTGATAQRADGLVTMDYDLCIGCASCAVACPYQARTIVHDQRWYFGRETRQERAVIHEERRGVAQKCTFCIEKVDEAEARGLTPGVDLEVTPACAASCIAQAITFGDFNDPDSNVSRLARENDSFQMHAELGTDPQIRYLYRTPTVPGRDPAPGDEDDAALRRAENPLAGRPQTFWDWRAAMNWGFGGLSSGFAIMAWLAYMLGAMPASTLPLAHAAAVVLMAVGLFFVFLKIGRKLRFAYAIRRPHTSWMTRELYAVAVFYLTVLADLLWPHPALHAVAALAAVAFLICQAKILHMAKGIPSWRVPLIPWMIVASGLLEGTGLLALAGGLFPALLPPSAVVPAAGLVLVAVNAVLWRRYRATAKAEGVGPLARDVLARMSPGLHAIGHGAAALLFAAMLAWPGAPGAAIMAGLAAIAGGFFWKFGVITRACHQQGFALAKMPQRGSGTRAAPLLPDRIGGLAGEAAE